MIPYLILVMCTDILVGTFSYTSLINSKTESTQTNMKRTLEQIRDNVSYNVRDFNRIGNQLFSSTTFQQQLQVKDDPYHVLDVTLTGILPVLETTTALSVNNLHVYVYANNNMMKEVYDKASEQIQDKSYSLLNLNRIANRTWYQEMLVSNKDNVWRQVEADREWGNISLLRKLISFYDFKKQIGYLRLSIKLSDLFQSVQSYKITEGTVVRVLDKTTGQTIYDPTPNQTVKLLRKPLLQIQEDLPNTNWVLEAVVPRTDLKKEAVRIRNMMLIICSLSFLGMALIGLIVAKYFARKVKRIVTRIQNFQEGNFDIRIQVPGRDEFSLISIYFNRMANHIEELIREVFIRNIQKKEAELNALQAQISPHFLYNTLSSINSLASMGDITRLTKMVTGLARFYRLTLNEGNMLISLSKEIQQVKSYIEIQQIKYADRFSVNYDIDPNLLELHIPKLILQPFVENVLKHAWYDERIHIRIVAEWQQNEVVLKIIDDGVGITQAVQQKLKQLKSEENEYSSGYGIRNVDQRIRIQYGESWGVSIFSRLGIGTTVVIRIPLPLSLLKEMKNSNLEDVKR
ncbi:sensor histidine kinase [Paenibacillus glycanilyticus]|uniref:sensor histidine kinase n=1 Tax=Paenibacillus glycanilyticus TaxID=126569 RepID=UPI0013E35A7F|nr:histidine kinase [Paenibacillus glycanilyticus]